MTRYSYEDIAMDYSLWATYVDPHATMTEETFNSMTLDEKIELQKRLFGPECQDEDF
jgi:hypothetical protein